VSKLYTYQSQQFLPVEASELFQFFSVPENLSKLTPPETGFQVVHTTDERIVQNTRLTYRLKQMGIPMKWVAKIEEWNPDESFTDVQVKGPFAWYKHRHILEKTEGGTIIRDELQYRLPFGWLGELFGNYFVRKTLEKTFRYRQEKMIELFIPG
jgi:ligand-binding SRPBCC domain-containing protein